MTNETQDLQIPLKEKLKSIPEIFGIRVNEEPEYRVISTDGDFEVRQYSRQVIAKVSMKGLPFDDFREAAFKKLANYIFKGNKANESIPMTSPVMEQHGSGENIPNQIAMKTPLFQQETEEGGWTMSFILPKEFTLKDAPKPDDSDISLEEVAPYEVAVHSYSGNNSLEKIKTHERHLADWLKSQPQLKMQGKFMVAQYDAPFVIPLFKRNEIQVRLESLH